MEGNAAQADRAWERLAKRGWKCTLHGPEAGNLPWVFTATRFDQLGASTAILSKAGTTRIEAVLLGAAAVEERHD